MSQQFPKAVGVTLDSSGAGTVSIAPTYGDWVVLNIALTVSSATAQPTARLYRNFVAAPNYLSGSYTGSNDNNTDRIILRGNEQLFCVWTGGDPGARATMVCQITQYAAGEAPAE